MLFQLNFELFTAKWLMQNNGILWLFVIWLGYVNLLHWNSWGFHVLPNNCNQICWMYTHKHTFHPPKRHYWCVHCAWSMSMEMIFKQHKYIWNVTHEKSATDLEQRNFHILMVRLIQSGMTMIIIVHCVVLEGPYVIYPSAIFVLS